MAVRLASVGRQAEPRHVFLQRRGQGIEQARNGFVKRQAGDHRRHHRAHAGIGIGLGAGPEALGRWLRELHRQVVARGAALHQHLERADVRAQVLVLGRAVAANPGRGRQQQLERPAVAHAFAEIAVAVGVGIDEAGMDQPVGGVDDRGIGGGCEARLPDFGNAIAVD